MNRAGIGFLWMFVAAGLYPVVFWPLERAAIAGAHLSQTGRRSFYEMLSLDHHFPEMLDALPAGSLPRWVFSLLPAAIVLAGVATLIIAALVNAILKRFKPTEHSLINDPEFGIRHGTLSTPALDHSAALHQCLRADVGRRFRFSVMSRVLGSPKIAKVDATVIDDAPKNVL